MLGLPQALSPIIGHSFSDFENVARLTSLRLRYLEAALSSTSLGPLQDKNVTLSFVAQLLE
jgi:hypothetical protein